MPMTAKEMFRNCYKLIGASVVEAIVATIFLCMGWIWLASFVIIVAGAGLVLAVLMGLAGFVTGLKEALNTIKN